jgi:hypothetical protein
MFFGQYLLSRGAINREALIDAIERQRSTNLSLVELAVRDGCTRLEASGFRLRPEPPFSTEGDEPAGDVQSSVRARVMAGDSEADVRVFV